MLKTSASFLLLLVQFSSTVNTVSMHFTRCENIVKGAAGLQKIVLFLLFAAVVALFYFIF